MLEHHSQGSYGGVYRAVRTGQEHAGPVALKLALYPWDPRFAREEEVLSRIHHPSVPRLLGRGVWRPAPGVEHPYLVMEWIEGTPLYKWARQHAPSVQQVRSEDVPAPEKPAADPAAVGDSSDKASSAHVPAKQKTIAQDTLPKPLPRQAQPDERGHCPGRKHVPLNGLCWLEYPGLTGEECRESGYEHIKGRCYAPVFTPQRKPQPTSEPVDSP